MIGMVGPDLPLMRGALGATSPIVGPTLTPAEVDRVLRLTGLDGLVAELPGGLGVWLGDGGGNLSVGQRQRIALVARHRGTVLLATDDPDELALADQVWILDHGRLVETLDRAEYLDRAWLAGQQGTPWTAPMPC